MLPRSDLEPGLCILHGNRLEDLTDVVVDWVKNYPLAPLEDEIFLVQSNGMAQWLKLALAADSACGISAAQQFQMPARFLWQIYRNVLGLEAVPLTSPFDKSRLVWRLLRMLPDLITEEMFGPLQRFLRDDSEQRKAFQLAERLADLYDQYQVYRADWLAAWQTTTALTPDDYIFRPGSPQEPLGEERWQAELWRRLLADLPDPVRKTSRAAIHTQFVQALDQGVDPALLPGRIIVFGLSSLPLQALEALHALARYSQILMLVQNPCQHYWGDIIEDRALLSHRQQRHAHADHLSQIAPNLAHRHANPLLASWGKQGRDYIGLLYSYDVPEKYQSRFQQIDLFQAPGDHTLLQKIQQGIFDLAPIPDVPQPCPHDASVAFHSAHSPQREVEILHDQLLQHFLQAQERGQALHPRDVIVMVPDIETYAASIEAVFGNMPADDRRYIPYTLSDRSQRRTRPLAYALEALLQAPQLRFTLADVLDLLDVSALRERFELAIDELPLVRAWARGAGIRWGLHGAQRAALDLPHGLEQNSWQFGLQRMLLGYASGSGEAWQGIEPYPEVGGLQADVAGKLAHLLATLDQHWQDLRQPGTPSQWEERLQRLLADLFLISDPDDIALEANLLDALQEWQQACTDAEFHAPLPLSVVREVWLGALDETHLSQRFLAGRVNFCTLMPMRSIPFRLVCLLGMNDGDYPRSQTTQDFDLMTRRQQYRPGDRSRRDDDRYLFLEAVLAARENLYISWVGRSVRDNEPRPPSVLVAQLRDYLDSHFQLEGTATATSRALTVEHPLQPFSTSYFTDSDPRLFSYAHEWHTVQATRWAMATQHPATQDIQPAPMALPAPNWNETIPLTPAQLTRFLKDPSQHFFSTRLQTRFDSDADADPDSEPFTIDALAQHQLTAELLTATWRRPPEQRAPTFALAANRLLQSGVLPLGGFAEIYLADLRAKAWNALTEAWTLAENYPEPADTEELNFSHTWVETAPAASAPTAPTTSTTSTTSTTPTTPTVPKAPPAPTEPKAAGQAINVQLSHWLSDLRGNANGERLYIELTASNIAGRPDKCLALWTQHLLANACGIAVTSCLVGHDARHELRPVDPSEAIERLQDLLDAWCQGLCRPLPLACRTGFAWLKARDGKKDPMVVAEGQYDGGYNRTGEVNYSSSTALRRSFPDFAQLSAAILNGQSEFSHWATALYAPMLDHLSETLTASEETSA